MSEPGGFGEVGGVGRHQVVRDDRRRGVEPERGQRGEDAALVGDLVAEDDVEHGDAVGRDDEHAVVADLVELAHLPGVVVRERDVAHGVTVLQRVHGASRVRDRTVEIETLVETRRPTGAR